MNNIRTVSNVDPTILLFQFKGIIYSIPRKILISFEFIVFNRCFLFSAAAGSPVVYYLFFHNEKDGGFDPFQIIAIAIMLLISPGVLLYASFLSSAITMPFWRLESKVTRALLVDDVGCFLELYNEKVPKNIEISGVIPCTKRNYTVLHLCNAVGALRIKSLFPLQEHKRFIYDLFAIINNKTHIDGISRSIFSFLQFEDIKFASATEEQLSRGVIYSRGNTPFLHCIDGVNEEQEKKITESLSREASREYTRLKNIGMVNLYNRYVDRHKVAVAPISADVENQLSLSQVTNLSPLLRMQKY